MNQNRTLVIIVGMIVLATVILVPYIKNENSLIAATAMEKGYEECPKFELERETIWVKSCSEYLKTAKAVSD